jgi:hypothetical protein
VKGLSRNIENALITVIEGLGKSIKAVDLDDDKVSQAMASKISSFQSAKKLLNKWISSPSSPSQSKVEKYAKNLISSGNKGLKDLESALSKDIEYDELDETKYKSAIAAKPVILDAIFELESLIKDLELQVEISTFNFGEKEFRIGFPERYAKGEIFPLKDYYKSWYNDEEDAVNICPFSSEGEVISLNGLKIQLPKTPYDKKKILFSDLPKKEQYWRRQEVPNITPENEELYSKFILEEFRRRREGVFFKNNGKTVYLTGNHYFALQWCEMSDNGSYMDFRYAQLHMFYHTEACIRDARCLGQLFVKSRRTGFTYEKLFVILNNSTSTRNGLYGMTSKTDDDVKEAFAKFSYAFLNLPFYFRPVVKGTEDSLTNLEFGKPSNTSKEAKKSRNTNTRDYLSTKIDRRATSNGSYDSVKLNMYLGDEFGKWAPPNDYIKHLGQISPTMMPSGRVVGKAFIGSTIGALEKGGNNASELYYNSNVSERNPVTQKTKTALYSYFLPAQDNMEEFTDIYGKCWTDQPPAGTKNVLGTLIKTGSNEYLDAVEKGKREQSEKAFSEQKRTYPRIVEDAFRNTEEITVFNRNKIYEQIAHNKRTPTEDLYTVGNFDWKNGEEDGPVVFNPNPSGRFKVAWIPSAVDDTFSLQNRVRESNGRFYPLNTDLAVAGCDPFSLASTHGEGSKGSIHAITYKVQYNGAPSWKFIFEYLARPSDTVFFEDVIKVCKFYGIPILVESNRIDLLRHMYNRGYRGFAIDRLDRPKHKLNDHEEKYGGQMMSSADILDSHMNITGSYIEDYIGVSRKEEVRPVGEMGDFPFNETLEDWLHFNPKKRTAFDATISSGLCLMAANKDRYLKKPNKSDTPKVLNIISRYTRSKALGR